MKFDINDLRVNSSVAGSEGARRATGEPATDGAATEGGHRSTEVSAKKTHRSFTAKYKLQILELADKCKYPGEIGALLRKEGLYSSHLSKWRKLRNSGALNNLSGKKRGPIPQTDLKQKDRIIRLQKRIAKLENELLKAHTIIDVQKKLSQLLAASQEIEK